MSALHVERITSPDPNQLATAVFVLGKHPREEPLVGLAASLFREHVQGRQ